MPSMTTFSQQPSVAVVILNWNGKALLGQFLPSLVKYSPNAVIYVADNASTDASVAFVTAHFPEIKIIINAGNYGFAKGYNEALKTVEEDIYVLVNSDIEVTENWLEQPLQRFTDPSVAIIQPKIRDHKDPKMFEYAGAAGGFIDQYGYPFCRGRIFDTVEEDRGQYDDSCSIFWASGACFFIRKAVYRELGGFDADFFAHQEEIDLCWRSYNAGYTALYEPKSLVYHVGGATLQKSNPKKTFLNFRNSLLMLVKNLPAVQAFPTLFVRMIFDGLAAFQFLFAGKPAHFIAVLKAHYHFYTLLYSTIQKRSGTKRKRYYKVSSIVIRYYAKKQRRFSSLF